MINNVSTELRLLKIASVHTEPCPYFKLTRTPAVFHQLCFRLVQGQCSALFGQKCHGRVFVHNLVDNVKFDLIWENMALVIKTTVRIIIIKNNDYNKFVHDTINQKLVVYSWSEKCHNSWLTKFRMFGEIVVEASVQLPRTYTRDTRTCDILSMTCYLHVLRYEREENRKRICIAFAFACVVDKNPKTPKLSPIADNAITRGGLGSLVSLVYICDCYT